jgi:diguanylate cyclase (GGDEF)-like protein
MPKKTIATLIGFLLLLIISLLDIITNSKILISFFYLIPISYAVLFISVPLAIVYAFISASVEFSVEFFIAHDTIEISIFNASLCLVFFILQIYSHNLMQHLLDKLRASALLDALTNIFNWRAFNTLFVRELEKSQRNNFPFTLIYFDIDNFKYINDTFGHHVGDMALKEMCHIVNRSVRSFDIFARLGGDEFAILLPSTDFTTSNLVINRIISQVATCLSYSPTSISLGACTFNKFDMTADNMINMVDAIMYEVKKSGKANYKHNIYE